MTTLALPEITDHEAPSNIHFTSSTHREATAEENQEALLGSFNALYGAVSCGYNFDEFTYRGLLRGTLAPLSSTNEHPATFTQQMTEMAGFIVDRLSPTARHPDTQALLRALSAYSPKAVAA